MENQFTFELIVRQAPPYQYDHHVDLFESDWMIHQKSVNQIKNQISQQLWYTHDHDCSPSALIFFSQSKKYYSLYSPLQPPYGRLAAAEGGIHLFYYHQLPWTKLRPLLTSSGNDYHDIRGHDCYTPRKDVSYEEIIILKEILKKEGALVQMTGNHIVPDIN
jgi:hypothetical protein